ncbi:profilin-2-like [Syngnathoides biaculeatus]|uniref:profilin-2-like n=1 Tax=Syngnathoides biaculeatus TaxID=300417 RepID=UPI002ADDBF3D|nr:profilin-2-like [Syngnathoides biaculeatus]
MSWQGYVDSLIGDGSVCQDAAIVGYCGCKGVWASSNGGMFSSITADEIDKLALGNREALCTDGLTLGKVKCSVIRDLFDEADNHTMDLRTKCTGGGPTYNITIGKSNKAFVLVMGKEGTHGGKINVKAHGVTTYLRQSGY